MTDYDILRADVAGVIPEAYSNQFLDSIIAESAVLSTFTTIRVGTKVNNFPVLASLPSAGFVSETEAKPTSKVTYSDKVITIEEVAVIVPVHEDVVADSTIDLFAQIRPLVGQAIGQVVDDAVLFGTGKPSTWGKGLVTRATEAGHVASLSTTVDIADALNTAYAFVEADGYDVSQVYAGPSMRSRLRGLRNENGDFLYTDLRSGNAQAEQVYGSNLRVVKNGTWDDDTALAIVADRSKLVCAMRQDITYKVLDQATVGSYNLAERDMLALRVKVRLGWEMITNASALNATPTPLAVITAAAAS